MILSIADTFIKRPVLTTVCTIIILLLGGVSLPLLPIEYVPQIAPIQVQISATYTGADPETIETTVTTPIERKLDGTRDMEYFSSTSVAGTSSISAYFAVGTDPNADQVNVQNNLQQAIPLLPTPVQQQGVVVKTASTSLLLVYGFYSPNDTYDATFISNYVDLFVNDEIARVPGVGQVNIFGQLQYAMRFWIDPNALASRGVTINDVVSAVKSQNTVVGGGAIGAEPAPKGQRYEIPLKLQGFFRNVAEAENIVVKVVNGTQIKVKDVGRVELGAQTYSSSAKINGKPGVALGIYQLPGSNALDVAKQVEAKIKDLEQNFPPNLKQEVVYDTVSFIEESTKEVLITLIEAVGLVVLVIFIFLQDWRPTIIPTISIPVSLVGSMVFAKLLGFSINSLTMFGLVLATGLVVDDAILVVEAIAAKIQNEGLSPRRASVEAMNELTGAVISTSLVLMAVFVPVAFFPGATGLMYRQFALIIAFSIAVSTFNALSFSPSIAAILLRPPQSDRRGPLNWFFGKFNQGFAWVLSHYIGLVQFLIRLRYLVIALFVVGLVATVFMFRVVPSGFVPSEDQGSILGFVQGPNIASLQYTSNILDQVHQSLTTIPEIQSTATISGAGFNGNAANQGIFFANLKPWSERTKTTQTVDSILKGLNKNLGGKIIGAVAVGSSSAPIPGFSPLGGFNMQIEDTTNGKYSFQEFEANAKAILQKANQTPVFAEGRGAFTQFTANTPQYEIDINRDQLNALNVDFTDALTALGTSIGSSYVSQFVFGPRYYQVYVQLEGEFRNKPEDLKQIYVRSSSNTTSTSNTTTASNSNMVSLDQLVTIKPYTAPAVISHFNEYRSILLQGNQASGYSTGQGIETMNKAYQEAALPGIKFDWSDLSREQVAAGSLGSLIFLFAIIMVFLVLSAQYESYVDPMIILLTVPLAILGALSAIALRRLVDPILSNDVYCNVALVMLIGLASKNAILIVEFANQAREQGKTIVQAALTAAEERFRPILMTAFAALVGFFPLVVASGAGANSRHSLGTAVFGGLLVATFLSLLLVPVLYVVIKSLEATFLHDKDKTPTEPPTPPSASPQSEQEPSPDLTNEPEPHEATRKFQADLQ